MSPLPWLLDWPPSRATVAVFLVVSAFSVGTVALFGDVVDRPEAANVTVEEVDVTVRLNDEVDFPEGGDGTVRTCLGSGTPGDKLSVTGAVVVDVPTSDRREGAPDAPLNVTVGLAHTEATTTDSVRGPGRVQRDVFWLLEDDESLSVGDTATVRASVRQEGSTVARATRNVTVQNGSRRYDC